MVSEKEFCWAHSPVGYDVALTRRRPWVRIPVGPFSKYIQNTSFFACYVFSHEFSDSFALLLEQIGFSPLLF